MYEAITSTDIDKSKWREKGRNVMEVQSSVLSKNASEFMSYECRVGLEGWRWLAEMNRI